MFALHFSNGICFVYNTRRQKQHVVKDRLMSMVQETLCRYFFQEQWWEEGVRKRNSYLLLYPLYC